MTELTKNHLIELIDVIKNHFEIDNSNGFIEKFYQWVVSEWSSRKYYTTDIVDSGFDVSSFPESTNQKMTEVISTYCEFINANTGQSIPTFMSGGGMRTQSMEELLDELYADEVVSIINHYVEAHQISIPLSEQANGIETIIDWIYQGFEDQALDTAADEIVCISSSIISATDGSVYSCPINGPNSYENGRFGHWTLVNFKNALLLYKNDNPCFCQ